MAIRENEDIWLIRPFAADPLTRTSRILNPSTIGRADGGAADNQVHQGQRAMGAASTKGEASPRNQRGILEEVGDTFVAFKIASKGCTVPLPFL